MERMVRANGLDLCCEDFGSPRDPCVLMIMGHGTPGVVGPDPVSERLVAASRYLVRYDARDTGRSTCIEFAAHPYTLADMAADAVGVLDALGIAAAHLFGGSMGGMVAQEIAIGYPDRVLSLTSFMSTPAVHDQTATTWTSGLPPIDPKVLAVYAEPTEPLTTPEQRVEFGVKLSRVLSGSFAPFDEARAREMFERQAARSTNPDAAANHTLAIAASRDRTELLHNVTVPALVIHGTEDPIIPFPHGVATAEAIPGAKFLPIEGLGHEMPAAVVPLILTALLELTAPQPA